jgi:hypothetical protein
MGRLDQIDHLLPFAHSERLLALFDDPIREDERSRPSRSFVSHYSSCCAIRRSSRRVGSEPCRDRS